jgi:DNA mismatch repair protein MutS
MAGIPHHAVDSYIRRLIQAGHRVAICDQTEVARPGKIVNRQISKILSPGTLITENFLIRKYNQYLLSMKLHKTDVFNRLVRCLNGRISNGRWGDLNALPHIFAALGPREMLIDAADRETTEQLPTRDREMFRSLSANCAITELPHSYFDPKRGSARLLENSKVSSLSGYGVDSTDSAIWTAGALIFYAADNLR